MDVEIRQIREQDIDGFRAAVDIVARERRYLYLTEAPPLEQAKAFVTANITKGAPHLVAVDNGCITGWCTVIGRARAIQAHVADLAMGVLPEWRDRGLGRQLLSAGLRASDAFGFTRIELGVFATNKRAHALYCKHGFAEEGLKRRSALIDGVYIDEIIMARLAPADCAQVDDHP